MIVNCLCFIMVILFAVFKCLSVVLWLDEGFTPKIRMLRFGQPWPLYQGEKPEKKKRSETKKNVFSVLIPSFLTPSQPWQFDQDKNAWRETKWKLKDVSSPLIHLSTFSILPFQDSWCCAGLSLISRQQPFWRHTPVGMTSRIKTEMWARASFLDLTSAAFSTPHTSRNDVMN